MTGTIVARASGATAPDGSARLTAPLRPGTGEGPAPSANRWRTSIVIFVLTAVINALLVIAVLAALDPYDTGRFAIAPLWRDRIDREKNSRGRDPQFDSAIFGNSRIELLRPELLDKNTGMRFVSLPILGAEPIEEFVLLRYFLRHHSNPRALVIGLDETWCFNPLQSELTAEYRDWLYSDSVLNYIVHLYSFRSIEQAWRVHSTSISRADGFDDYEPLYHAAGADAMEVVRKKFNPARPTAPFTSTTKFPAASQLEQILRDLPVATVVVLAWVPIHISMVSLPGSPSERAIAACHAAYVFDGSVHSRTRIVNWSVDRPENRIDENYFDNVHYRTPIATAFGQDIADDLDAALSE